MLDSVMFDRFVILSDGKRMAFFMPGDPPMVYLLGLVYPTCVSMKSICERIEMTSLDSVRREYFLPPVHHKITLDLDISGPIVTGGEELLKGFTPIDSLSIEGLLKIIQDRIEERDGDEVQSL